MFRISKFLQSLFLSIKDLHLVHVSHLQGLMLTAAFVYWGLNWLNITVNIRNVCVLLAPWFASNTSLATYFLVKQVKDKSAALFAAAFIAIVPSYISRSAAGSYDYEGIAIFALIFTYGMWLKSVKTGSVLWSTVTTLCYFYMAAAWGGYVFITNLIPLYTLIMILFGYYTHKLYIAYSTFYTFGTLFAMQIPFVGFNAVQSSEHFASLSMFCFIQLYAFVRFVQSHLSQDTNRRLLRLVIKTVVILILLGFFLSIQVPSLRRFISPWTGRFYSTLFIHVHSLVTPLIHSQSQSIKWKSYAVWILLHYF